MIRIFLIVTLFSIVGCAGNPQYGGYYPHDPEEIKSKQDATIVVFKKGINATNYYAGAHVEVKLDGNKVGDLMEDSFIILKTKPGKHKVTIDTPFWETPYDAMIMFRARDIEKEFIAGEIYYLHYEIEAEPIRSVYTNVGYASGHESHQSFKGVSFTVKNPEAALPLLRECREIVGY